MKYILAIDSGATSTVALLFPADDKCSANVYEIEGFPPLNLNLLSLDESLNRLLLITRISSGITGNINITAVSAGISGAGDVRLRKKLQKLFSDKSGIRNVGIYPDTETAFASAFSENEKKCGVLIAGTGSVLYCRNNNGEMKKTGGWGRTTGDEGSGYWIAREALSKICACFDGREKKSMLTEIIERKYGLKKNTFIRKIYHENFNIPCITYDVFRCAEQNDRISINIISEAAKKLAEHFKPLGNKKYKIALCGSLFTKETLLEKMLQKITSEKYKNITLIKPQLSPVWGALRLGINNLKKINAGR